MRVTSFFFLRFNKFQDLKIKSWMASNQLCYRFEKKLVKSKNAHFNDFAFWKAGENYSWDMSSSFSFCSAWRHSGGSLSQLELTGSWPKTLALKLTAECCCWCKSAIWTLDFDVYGYQLQICIFNFIFYDAKLLIGTEDIQQEQEVSIGGIFFKKVNLNLFQLNDF